MDVNQLISVIKRRPDYDRVGMILCHNGVVRGTSRDGRKVSGLRVTVDNAKLSAILDHYRAIPGIVDIQVEIAANQDLGLGDDVMALVVAGDIRETVISVMTEVLNAIKTTVTAKTEFFV